MTIQDIFKLNPMDAFFIEARKQSKTLDIHITGKNMKEAIVTMDEYETDQKKNIRQKYARSNMDLMERIHRPIDKVFSAKGGSLVINLPDAQLKDFTAFLQNISKGMSLRTWVQQIALNAYNIDPNGLVFMETDANGMPYPTYKSTTDLYYYEKNGRNISLVVFKLQQCDVVDFATDHPEILAVLDPKDLKTQYYRIVDNKTDKIVAWSGNSIVELSALTLVNPFGVCPGLIVSDIFEYDSKNMLSPDNKIVELLTSILMDNSVFENWKKLHMFPKHWRMLSLCPNCQGNKTVGGIECPECQGTGYQKRSSVRDELLVAPPDVNDGKISFPTAFDGYSEPAIEAWELSVSDLNRMTGLAFETKWGYQEKTSKNPTVKVDGQNKTATQVIDEAGDKNAGLYPYSTWAETIETFVIDLSGKLLYPATYKGSSVNYGDRYINEGPDVIWQKYSDARTKGGSQAALDSLLRDYYEAKYFGDPLGLERAMKQMHVEPWVHSTANQVQELGITDLDKTCKVYFSEWSSTVNDMQWVMLTEETLRKQMQKYSQDKLTIVTKELQDAALQEALARQQAMAAPANNPANS